MLQGQAATLCESRGRSSKKQRLRDKRLAHPIAYSWRRVRIEHELPVAICDSQSYLILLLSNKKIFFVPSFSNHSLIPQLPRFENPQPAASIRSAAARPQPITEILALAAFHASEFRTRELCELLTTLPAKTSQSTTARQHRSNGTKGAIEEGYVKRSTGNEKAFAPKTNPLSPTSNDSDILIPSSQAPRQSPASLLRRPLQRPKPPCAA